MSTGLPMSSIDHIKKNSESPKNVSSTKEMIEEVELEQKIQPDENFHDNVEVEQMFSVANCTRTAMFDSVFHSVCKGGKDFLLFFIQSFG